MKKKARQDTQSRIELTCPEESAKILRCPGRGLYTLLRYEAGDDTPYPELYTDPEDSLILIEINLRRFRNGPVGDAALKRLDGLFSYLEGTGCSLIVRFLYDWDGKNHMTEPGDIGVILEHMRQTGAVLYGHAPYVFTAQGLFTGNWGEMHGTRFDGPGDVRLLYATWAESTKYAVRISVRTPKIWQTVAGTDTASAACAYAKNRRLLPGLYNDGMFGSVSDLGTYEERPFGRKDALEMQDKLCLYAPNGGEATGCTVFSEASSAVSDMEKMHISYLNRNYDERTLNRWKETYVSGHGVWDGTSYFKYINAHLGYRFVIDGVTVRKRAVTGKSRLDIAIKNTGFAPIYKKAAAELVFVRGTETVSVPLKKDTLIPADKENTYMLTVSLDRDAANEVCGSDIFLRMTCPDCGDMIPFGNEKSGRYGTLIGKVTKG